MEEINTNLNLIINEEVKQAFEEISKDVTQNLVINEDIEKAFKEISIDGKVDIDAFFKLTKELLAEENEKVDKELEEVFSSVDNVEEYLKKLYD